jgi:hypothetical protein
MLRAAIASVLLLGISSVRAGDVEAILAQYVIWRGGTAFEALQSFHERGDVAQGGLRGKFEQWQVNDGRLRRNETLGPLSSALAASESAGWQTTASGQIEDLGGDAERARRVVVLSFDRAAANQGAHYSLLGTEQFEGKSWDVVRVQFGGPDTYDLLIAPGSGELLGVRITEDRKTRFVRYADWRLINEVRMPFAEEQTGSNAADHKVHHAAEMQINVPNKLAQPFVKDRSGLAGLPSVDRLKVLFVAPGSPAEKGGWKEGAEVIAVDGHKIDAKYSGSELSHWSKQPPGTVVTLTLADGKTRQLILADYY